MGGCLWLRAFYFWTGRTRPEKMKARTTCFFFAIEIGMITWRKSRQNPASFGLPKVARMIFRYFTLTFVTPKTHFFRVHGFESLVLLANHEFRKVVVINGGTRRQDPGNGESAGILFLDRACGCPRYIGTNQCREMHEGLFRDVEWFPF